MCKLNDFLGVNTQEKEWRSQAFQPATALNLVLLLSGVDRQFNNNSYDGSKRVRSGSEKCTTSTYSAENNSKNLLTYCN